MKYTVVFTPTARLQALNAAEYIANDSPHNALRWYEQLETAVLSLDTFPHRCPRAPESDFLHDDLRYYLHKSHRILFRIDEPAQTVHILQVRHSAQRPLGQPPAEDSDDS